MVSSTNTNGLNEEIHGLREKEWRKLPVLPLHAGSCLFVLPETHVLPSFSSPLPWCAPDSSTELLLLKNSALLGREE